MRHSDGPIGGAAIRSAYCAHRLPAGLLEPGERYESTPSRRSDAGRVTGVAEIKVDVEPGEVGFDAGRLGRLDPHYRRYVDEGRLAGWTLAVSRHGRVAHLSHHGRRDLEADLPVTDDTLWRIYSMTKPVTSVAAMMLYEQGVLELMDPVSRWIPSFADVRVYRGGAAPNPSTVPAVEPVRVWHLLTHTSGLTYGFHHAHAVDEMYRQRGYEFTPPPGVDLAAACDTFAELPLLFQPGTEWNYSVSTDVLGRVVEVASGQSLDAFFAEHILGPLGMDQTAWSVDPSDADRLGLALHGRPGRRSRAQPQPRRRGPCSRPSCSPAAAGWCRRPATTTGSPACCSRAASSTACACSAPAPLPT